MACGCDTIPSPVTPALILPGIQGNEPPWELRPMLAGNLDSGPAP